LSGSETYGEPNNLDSLRVRTPFWFRRLGKLLKYVDKNYTRHVRNIDEINELLTIGEYDPHSGCTPPIVHRTINTTSWVIPAFDPDHMYAGVYSALRFMSALERKGKTNNLILYGNPAIDKLSFSKKISSTVGVTPRIFLLEMDSLPAVDVAFATFWSSAYIVRRYKKAARHIYFVQDYEPDFYPANALSRLAHESYTQPMDYVVHGIGLANYMKDRFNRHQHTLPFAVERDVYQPPEEPPAGKPFKVFFYGRPRVDRNDFALGVASLLKAKQLIPDMEVYCAGERFNPKIYGLSPEWWHNWGMLTRRETARIYRGCNVALVFGFTRATPMVALEAMACGCLLVTNRNDYEDWITQGGRTAVAVSPNPVTLAKTLKVISENWDEYLKVAKKGQILATSWDWNLEASRVIAELEGEAQTDGKAYS